MKAMRAIFSLLKDKPEQEALLLSILVDKLGDPDRKIASNVSFSAMPLVSSLLRQPCSSILLKFAGLSANLGAVSSMSPWLLLPSMRTLSIA